MWSDCKRGDDLLSRLCNGDKSCVSHLVQLLIDRCQSYRDFTYCFESKSMDSNGYPNILYFVLIITIKQVFLGIESINTDKKNGIDGVIEAERGLFKLFNF